MLINTRLAIRDGFRAAQPSAQMPPRSWPTKWARTNIQLAEQSVEKAGVAVDTELEPLAWLADS